MERIFTIPVNEAFEASAADPSLGCPFCALFKKLQSDELDLILGASMMEPDVRVKTNEAGFCPDHFDMLFVRGKRLPLALMLESHLDTVKKKLKPGALSGLFASKSAADAVKKVSEINGSCYLCDRIGRNFSAMVETAALLWQEDGEFRKKTEAQPYFCLPHYERLLTAAKERLGKEFTEFYSVVSKIEDRYLESLSEDVSAFCRSFDYRNTEEPLTEAEKSAPERTKKFLSSDREK